MDELSRTSHRYKRIWVVLSVLILSGVFAFAFFQPAFAQETIRKERGQDDPADESIAAEGVERGVNSLVGSAKLVSASEAVAGTLLTYTIVISNNSGLALPIINLTDTLPSDIAYVTDSLEFPVGTIGAANGNVITWTGALAGNSELSVSFQAMITTSAATDSVISNSVVIAGDGIVLTRTATTQVVSVPASALDASVKSASAAEAQPGDVLTYTLHLENSSGANVSNVVVTDSLGSDLIYVANSAQVPQGNWGVSGNVFTWTGQLSAQSSIDIHFQAEFSESLENGAAVTNTADIFFDDHSLSRSVTVGVGAGQNLLYLPSTSKPIPILSPASTRPNSNNQWTLSWKSTAAEGLNYVLHESKDPNFTSFTSYDLGGATTVQINQSPSARNQFFYRVRGSNTYGTGDWSQAIQVVGAYRDNFDDNTTGWTVRRASLWVPNDPDSHPRATYLPNYNQAGMINPGALELMMNDRWDWFLASPFAPAPELPYVIEWRSEDQFATPPPPNLASHGGVFGGDWNGGDCPHIGNVYETTNCFNQFYNFNIIYKGSHKLLFERVDELVFCPECGGSALKRLGDQSAWVVVENLTPNEPDPHWHTYRIEVRNTGLRFLVDNELKMTSPDTTYIHRPYFGLFASTDEYRPSHWLVDYYQIIPLDN